MAQEVQTELVPPKKKSRKLLTCILILLILLCVAVVAAVVLWFTVLRSTFIPGVTPMYERFLMSPKEQLEARLNLLKIATDNNDTGRFIQSLAPKFKTLSFSVDVSSTMDFSAYSTGESVIDTDTIDPDVFDENSLVALMSGDTLDITFGMTGDVDANSETNPKMDSSISLDLRGDYAHYTGLVDLRILDKKLYLRANDLPEIYGVDFTSMLDQWYYLPLTAAENIGSAATENVTGTTDLSNLSTTMTALMNSEVVARNLIVSDEVIESIPSRCFALTLNKTDLLALIDIVKANNPDITVDKTQFNDTTSFAFRLCFDASTVYPTQFLINWDQDKHLDTSSKVAPLEINAAVTLFNFGGSVNITAPEGARLFGSSVMGAETYRDPGERQTFEWGK